MTPHPQKRPIGFQALSPERLKEITSQGGIAAHTLGKAHEWTTEEARQASQKGVQSRRKRRTSGRPSA
jgi:hypothetical protein